MNRIFRIIWSKTRLTWVVASENAKRRGKGGGAVDERATALGLARDCDVVEAPPLAFAWQLRLGSLLVLLASCPPTYAIDYYWDADGGTAGAGGTTPTGTWSTGGATLSTNVNGATATGAVTTTTADRLFFSAGTDATGTYTVTVNGTQNIGRLTFQEGTVNLSGGTINFGVVSGLIDGDATPDTISSVIAGTNGVRFSGGTRTLTGTNTYTGQTVLGGSGLAQAAVILAAPGGNAVSGNLLQLGGGNYTSAGFVTLGAAEQINDTATVTLSSGHYSGSSIFSLNGFNETMGGINLGHQGNGSSVTFRNGAATDATVTLVGSGTYTTAIGDRLTGRSIQNGGAGRLNFVIALTGAGHQTFAGTAPSYTGTTLVNSGTLRLWNTSAWASNAILDGGTLNLHQTATGTPVAAGGNAATRTHSQNIGGAGGTLRKTGDGTVILSSNNTYQSATQIDQGTLRAGSATAFGNNSAVTLANIAGATMDLNSFNIAIGSLAGGGTAGGNVTMGSGNLSVGGNNSDTIYSGVISGTATVTKIGTGTQTLSGTNTYAGLTSVSGGTLQLGSGGNTGSISSAQATVAAGASLAVNRSDAFTLSQNVTGDGTLVLRGAGATTMTANSDIDHVVLEHGRLVTPGELTADDITFSNDGGATLEVTGTLQTATAGAALVTGGSSNDTVWIDAGATMLANGTLGDGADMLDVAGLLDTGAGSFDLNAGDDTFVIHDNTNVTGSVLGGAGNDTLNADIAASAMLGAVQTFETLTKSGIGTLDIVGPGISDFSIVNVNAGTLAIGASAMLDAPAGGSLATTVAGGATLAVAGNYGCGSGNDTLTVAGTVSGAGTIDLCGGDDSLTLEDGAQLNNVTAINGGAGAGDLLVLNTVTGFGLNGSEVINFELLQKNDAGTATLSGTHSFAGGTALDGGGLSISGSLETPTIGLADGTVLTVAGTVQAAGASQALISGSAGINTVSMGAGGTLRASGDLGNGADVLDVAGTLEVGGGTFLLGDGDDNFVVHDGTVVTGAVDGGAGLDTRTFNINASADLGALLGFEGVTKTGTGVLNITGPGATDLQAVDVLAGRLDVLAGASVIATVGATLNTVVAAGATLNVEGAYGCGDGGDNMIVAGTVSGSGTLDLCGGEDTLILRDGAVLANTISGGAHGSGDTLMLENAGALTFDASRTLNFEFLVKDNAGAATLTGSQSYIGGVALNDGTLSVAGVVNTPTVALADDTVLDITGTLQSAAATTTSITGSAGINTVIVGAGGTLRASGDLGNGDDVLDVAGNLDTGGGVFMLGGGDDSLLIHDGTHIVGTVDGGAGFDSLNTSIAGIADLGAVSTFEELIKSGAGTLNINGPAPSDFASVEVQGGSLNIAAAGSLNGVQNVTVASGASLIVDGSFTFTPGADTFTVAGDVSGLSSIDMLDGDDMLTIQDGADLSGLAGPVDGGTGTDTLNADIATSATLGGAIDFETLIKSNTGTLNILGPAASQFDTVLVQGGTLFVGAGAVVDPQTTVVDAGATMTVDGAYSGTLGNDTFTVSGGVNGTGTIDLLAGDDVLTINDGGDIGGLTNPIDGGSHTPAGDAVVLNFASDSTFSSGNVINFESLVKQNAGTVTLTGTTAFSGGTALDGGGLSISGSLETPTIGLADGTVLTVAGTVQAAGASQALISGSAGINTVSVGAGGTLRASGDLGNGADVLDVAGTLEVGGGTFLLGDGDDNFVVHDGTVVTGAVDGGAGLDTRTFNINASADLGALLGFEGVTKTGTGVLNITGPGATDLQAVDVLAGRLDVLAGASVIATVGATLNTVVAAGATLNVEGAYGCGDGGDNMIVAGTVSGSGTLDLCGGEDTLILRDGAVLANTISGGAHGSGDTLMLENAGALTFDASRTLNFEFLVKDNAGAATLTGSQSYIGGVALNDGTLSVAGVVNTPTVALADDTVLDITGTLQSAAATTTSITGSAGINTVIVGAGGTLRASGDLGNGDDVLDVAGTLDTGGGVFMLGGGDDHFVVHDTTAVTGTVDGGMGNDLINVDISAGNTVPLGAMLGFESLGKSGAGTLQINGPSQFIDVDVLAGTLELSGTGGIAAQTTRILNGATLNLTGNFRGTAGEDTFHVAGTVAGPGTLDLDDGNDMLVIQDGANLLGLATPLDGGAGGNILVTDIAGSATLGGMINFATLNKTNIGMLRVDGPAPSAFSVVNVSGGTLALGTAGDISGATATTVASGATLQVDGGYAGSAADDVFTLSGTLRGGGVIDLLDGDDVFTINTGATVAFSGVVDAAAATADRFVLAGAGSGSFDMGLIGRVFRNFEGFTKEGAGTWRLTGTGDRDWTVLDGTLIGDSASFGGDIANAAIVVFDQAFDGTFDRVLSGSGTLIKQNAGTLVVSGANTFSGTTQIAAGTLQVDGTLPGALTVSSGATLSGIGSVGSVTALAGGFVAPGNTATPFGTLTLTGDYAGGATVTINTQLGDSSSPASRLVIQGSASGTSPVLINPASGNGAQTAGDGISIILVGGVSPSDSFHLARAVQAGAFEYLLFQGGASDANDWFLRSELADPPSSSDPEPPVPAYRPGVAGYVLGPQANLEYGFTAIGNLRSRVGDQGRVANAKPDRSDTDAWMRVHVDEIDAVGRRFQALDLNIKTLQFGTDVYAYKSGEATAHFGLMASVGESRATFFDPARAIAGLATRAGNAETDVNGAGAYWTIHGTSGGYFDMAAQLLHYQNRYRDAYLASGKQSGWGGTLSAEIGAPFALGATNWRIEPQLQLVYQQLELGDFTDEVGAVARVKDDALRARAGVQLFRAPAKWLGLNDASPYLGFGAQRDFGDAASVVVGNTAVREQLPDTTGDVSVGFTGSVRPGITLHLDVRYQQSTEAEQRDGVRANFGFRMTF